MNLSFTVLEAYKRKSSSAFDSRLVTRPRVQKLVCGGLDLLDCLQQQEKMRVYMRNKKEWPYGAMLEWCGLTNT